MGFTWGYSLHAVARGGTFAGMRTIILVLAVWVAGVAVGQPASRPTSGPADQVADLRRMIVAMQRQVADLKAENQQLRAENLKLKKSIPAPAPVVAAGKTITAGMSKADAEAIAKANGWQYDVSPSERLVRDKTIKTERWESRFAGYPNRIIIENDVVIEVQR
jgi:cell division protein FtsB